MNTNTEVNVLAQTSATVGVSVASPSEPLPLGTTHPISAIILTLLVAILATAAFGKQ